MIKDYDTLVPVFEGPYDARTRVHEYGGASFAAYNGSIYFSSLPDDRVYQVKPGSKVPTPVTPGAFISIHDCRSSFTYIMQREEHGDLQISMSTLRSLDSLWRFANLTKRGAKYATNCP